MEGFEEMGEEATAFVKEKQHLFKFWKGAKKCKKECGCGEAGGRKLRGHGRKAGNDGCTVNLEREREREREREKERERKERERG